MTDLNNESNKSPPALFLRELELPGAVQPPPLALREPLGVPIFLDKGAFCEVLFVWVGAVQKVRSR